MAVTEAQSVRRQCPQGLWIGQGAEVGISGQSGSQGKWPSLPRAHLTTPSIQASRAGPETSLSKWADVRSGQNDRERKAEAEGAQQPGRVGTSGQGCLEGSHGGKDEHRHTLREEVNSGAVASHVEVPRQTLACRATRQDMDSF